MFWKVDKGSYNFFTMQVACSYLYMLLQKQIKGLFTFCEVVLLIEKVKLKKYYFDDYGKGVIKMWKIECLNLCS